MLEEFLKCIVLVCVPILAAYICRAAEHIADNAKANTDNELARRYVDEITRAVTDAVNCTCQTYVDDLKKAKVFNEEAQAEALKMALDAAKKSISDDALDFIQEVYGDVTPYLTTKIEAAVRGQRNIYMI